MPDSSTGRPPQSRRYARFRRYSSTKYKKSERGLWELSVFLEVEAFLRDRDQEWEEITNDLEPWKRYRNPLRVHGDESEVINNE